ncbi:ATP-binding protein [Mesomycoplasma bovoculi]|uniref:Helicase HerA central domain-containing protein n=1 Tax=Mesomycoplasma bovoculi M165/69 TaxID=743966 RepID=W5V1C5_9BACT|nr:DUF87 domain-containing protein [Mesomycoplasma bovoculi]AHH45543.1 hypothetical protein MYB_02710 [Mesomycoplasma bovoculi M165/69]
MLLYDELRVEIPIKGFLDTHIGVFGNTGSGKSNTVAKLYKTLFDKINKKSKLKNINSAFVFVDFHNEYKEYFSNYQYEKINIKTISPSEDFKISASSFWNYETLISGFSDFSQEEKKIIKKIMNIKRKFDLNIYYWMLQDINKHNLESDPMQLNKIIAIYNNNNNNDLKVSLYIDSLLKIEQFKHIYDNRTKKSKLIKNEKYSEVTKDLTSLKSGLTVNQYIDKVNIDCQRQFLFKETRRLFQKVKMHEKTKLSHWRLYKWDIKNIWYEFYSININKEKDNPNKFKPITGLEEWLYINNNETSVLEKLKVCLAILDFLVDEDKDMMKEGTLSKIKYRLFDLMPEKMSYIPDQIKIDNAQIIILSLKDEDVGLQKIWPIVVANELFNSQKALYSSGVDSSIHFIIDEAHNLISSKLSEETKDENINRLSLFEKFIREGRKFNFFLTISTQEPWGLDSGITSQLGNFFIHRFVNGNDLEGINKYIANSNDILYNKIPILNPGQCILWGSKFKTPLMIQVDKLGEENENKDKDKLKKETKNKSLEDILGL